MKMLKIQLKSADLSKRRAWETPWSKPPSNKAKKSSTPSGKPGKASKPNKPSSSATKPASLTSRAASQPASQQVSNK